MTSLAKQLQQLAIPGQPTLKQVASKRRDSLLFDGEAAADKSRDHIHSLALNGLYELINVDESFSDFEATLFHDRFKEFERSSQTSEVLKDIDSSIENFLRRLSPYFLHRMAQQCLEWLICVFRINKCNTDALMECVLPYYETKLFARVVQLLPLKDHTQKWYWLRPLKKAGSPLSKLTLGQYCLSNKAFLHFICEMVPLSLTAHDSSPARGSQKVISLYVSTVMAVLERARPVKEELILILLPYLEGGLKSSNRDYWASSCMIVSQLAVVASMKLDQKVLTCIIRLLSLGFDDMLRDSLCCLAVLCSHQKLDRFPKKVLHRLMNCDSLVPTLSSLSEVHSLTPLHSTLLSSLLDAHIKELKQGKMDDKTDGAATGKKEGVATSKKEGMVTGHGDGRALSLLLKLLDEVILEEGVAHYLIKQLMDAGVLELHTAGSEKEQLDMLDNKVSFLHQFLSTSLPGARPHGLGGAGLSLVLSVHHPNPSVRVDAIGLLGKSLSSKGKVSEVSCEEREFISSSLMSRLADDDPAVVLAVLQLGPKVLFSCLPSTEFLPCLLALLTKKRLWHSSSSWQDCALASLGLLTSKHLLQQVSTDSSGVVNDIVIKSIPLLFLARNGNEFGGRVLEVLKTSALGKTNPVLKSLSVIAKKEEWKKGCMKEHHKDEEILATANDTIFTHLGEAVAHLDHDSMDKLLSELVGVVCSTPTDGHEYYILTTVAAGAIKATPPTAIDIQHREAVRLLLHIQENIGSLEGGVAKKGSWQLADRVPLVRKNADKAVSGRLLLLWSLERVCEGILIPDNLSRSMWLNMASCSSGENLYYNLLLTLLSTLTQILDLQLEGKGQGVTEPCKVMIQKVLKDHFVLRGSLLRFLAMVWTTPLSMEQGQLPVSGLSPALQASSLSIAHAYLMSLSQTAAEGLVEDMCPLVPSLLIPLASPHQLIREKALGCLQALHDACLPPSDTSSSPSQHTCKPPLRLVHALLEFKVEIVSSLGQISQVLSKIYADFEKTSTLSLAPPPPTPTPRRKSRRHAESAAESAETLETPACKQLNWLEFVLLHVVDEGRGMPVFIQCQFLRVLEKVDHVVKLLALGPLVSSLLNGMTERASSMETDSNTDSRKDLWEYNALVLSQAIQCFTPSVASSLSAHPPLFQLLLRLLGQDTPTSSLVPSPLSLTLRQLTPKFFSALGDVELQGQVLRALVDVVLGAKSAEVTVEIKETMAMLPLSAVLVCGELNRDLHCLEKVDPPPTPSKRRRVKAATPPPTSSKEEVVMAWKRVTLVLEMIGPTSLKIPDVHTLIPLLFAILGRCLELEEEMRLGLEYTQQLLLSSLLNIASHLTSSQADITELISEREFDVGVVVQCIRLSSNPQTHHHAYSFLSSAAAIFPHLVLHNVMPIFAFMGASILRQDDQHSFQIITRTISSIIPPLIKSSSLAPTSVTKKRAKASSSSKTTPTTVEGVVAEIIRTFVNSIPHVPTHRQVLLFTCLVEQLGPSEYLHLALGLLLEKQAVQQDAVQSSKEKVGSGSVAGRVTTKLVVSIAQSFPPAVQILAAFKLTQHLVQLPLTKPASSFKLRQSPSSVFNVTTHTESQLRQFKSLTLSTITTLLSNKEFVSQVSSEYTAEIEGTVIKFLQCVLGYVSVLSKAVTEVKGEGVAVQNLMRKAYLVVDKITSLLSFDAFLEVISQLVGVADKEGVAGSESIQEKALEMLNSKLKSSGKSQFSKMHESYMLSAMDVLMGVVCEDSTPQSSQCLSLDCVRLIVKELSGDYHKKITKVLESVIEMLSNSAHSAPVRTSCLQCLVEVCPSLGPHLLPLLSSLLPLILAQLDKKRKSKAKRHHTQLQASAVSALHSVITTLPNFLGSSLPDIIIKLCSPALACDGTEPSELEKQASSSRNELCTAVPVRNLLPAYLKCYHEIVQLGKSSVLALLNMLSTTVVQLSKEDSKSYGSVLMELFQTCLDYRTKETKGPDSLSGIEEVECQCLEAFTALVVKLSEMQFRPVFLQLLDWATNPSSSPRTRAITFYHMADKVAERLKGLFLLFAGHFISNAVSLLNQNHKKKHKSLYFAVVEDSEEGGASQDEEGRGAFAEEQSCLLLRYMLQCLTKCFLYDKSQFLTKERFDSLMQALVNQVSNQVGGAERYMSRVEQHLSPCVAQLAVAAGKESLWKPLNQQLLIKTKHKSPQVRLGTLKVLHELYKKLGEEMVVLLPETTPYLYELMEDDNEEVEKLTQEVIRTVEGICGETLQF